MQAILLAGGRGTRMGSLTEKTPKPLVEVGGRLLIERPISKLADFGCERIILATGYRAEQFFDALGSGERWGVELVYSVEDRPLGTAGALALAAHNRVSPDESVIVMNADLISDHELSSQMETHRSSGAVLTMHVRQVDDPSRFGLVRFDESGRVTEFIEKPKQVVSGAWINAGTYVMRGSALLDIPLGIPISLEREIMPLLLESGARVQAHRENAYFRDVGTFADVDAATEDGR